MHMLILGGGVFLGVATLTSALARGHRVTVFNRGRARNAWPDGVEAITGDRSTDLRLLEARHWDAVIDTCGYTPADLRLSCDALRGCGRLPVRLQHLGLRHHAPGAGTGNRPARELRGHRPGRPRHAASRAAEGRVRGRGEPRVR